MISRTFSTFIARLCAALLIMLSATPFTRPFYTLDLAQLMGARLCDLCRPHAPFTIEAASHRDAARESAPEFVRPVETARSDVLLVAVFGPLGVDLVAASAVAQHATATRVDAGPNQPLALRV